MADTKQAVPSLATVRTMIQARTCGAGSPAVAEPLAAIAAQARAALIVEENQHTKFGAPPLAELDDIVEFPYGLLTRLVRLAEAAALLPGKAEDLDNKAGNLTVPAGEPGAEQAPEDALAQQRALLYARGTGVRDAAACMSRAAEQATTR
jgi:hypothetical protein